LLLTFTDDDDDEAALVVMDPDWNGYLWGIVWELVAEKGAIFLERGN